MNGSAAASVATPDIIASDTPVLSMRGITKTFPGVVALDDVDFDVGAGEVHALLGANGAGKSTLIKIASGLYRADQGVVEIAGNPVSFASTQDAINHGVSVIYQDFALVPELSVAENIFLGKERKNRWQIIDWRNTYALSRELLERVGARFSARARVETLGTGHRQLVEIAKALRSNANVVILDEPTASLSQGESDRLFEIIRDLAGQGVAIVYVSHRLEEIASLVDRVTVLRDGKSVGTYPVGELDRKKVVSLITGSDVEPRHRRDVAIDREPTPALSVSGLTRDGEFNNVSLEVRAGEVVVVTGLVGAGRTELLQTIFGLRRPSSGEMRVAGNAVTPHSPREAIGMGIVLIPEDRRGQGIALGLSVIENITLPILKRFMTQFGLSRAAQVAHAREMIASLGVKARSPYGEARTLSGGNQQKVVLAKWLSTEADILLFDEPTQGVDVGAKEEIYTLIDRLAEEGKAILIASSDMEEVLEIADRVVAMRAGKIVGEYPNVKLSAKKIIDAITHG